MSLIDALTGGENSAAKGYLNSAQDNLRNINLPSAAALTLPELQKYVQMGILTPEEAKAALIKGNAYDDIKLDPSTIENQTTAINQLKDVADNGGLTGTMKAQLAQALDTANTNTRGNNNAILEKFAAQGVPTSLLAGAFQSANNAQESRNANLTATQSAGQAEQNAINAMINEGNLSANLRGQESSEASNKAAAANAIQQWNAGTQTSTNEANANRATQANQLNLVNSQDVANKNVDTSNQRSVYNADVPQKVFNNALSKATGQAQVSGQQANQAMQTGNQNLALIGALTGAASTALAPGAAKPQQPVPQYAEGGLVPGDSPKNDIVPARLSPGEAVIPRSVMNSPDAPNRAKGFITNLLKNKPVKPAHPDDVRSILDALSNRRETSVGASRG